MNLDTLDKSFLRLVTDFSEAKNELMQNSQYVYKDTIVISPNEKTLQISNSLTSIAFDDSYIVSLVNCSDNVILDITNKVYINEFQDHNGIYQIAFEIAPILQDFYFQRLYLRFEHTGSDLVLWSNSFICTDNVQSFRLDYGCYSYYQGTSYEIANFKPSIRIAGYFNLPSSKDSTKITTLINGDIRRSRTTQALEYAYNVEFIDTFAFDRLMVALNSELVYIDGVRFVTSENVQSDERFGMSNQFATTFKGQFVATEKYNANYQIAPALSGSYSPINRILFPALNPLPAIATFNYNIASVTGVQVYKDGVLFLDVGIPSITDNEFTFNLSDLVLGEYYVLFTATDVNGQTLAADATTWTFNIMNGQYNKTQYNNSQYLTN